MTEVLSDGRKLTLADTSHYIGRIGPSAAFHELFTQNNLGIVSKIRVPLLPRQSDLLVTIIRLHTEQDLPNYIEAMRSLKAEGTVDTLPHIGNRYRCLGFVRNLITKLLIQKRVYRTNKLKRFTKNMPFHLGCVFPLLCEAIKPCYRQKPNASKIYVKILVRLHV